jgi:diguanylate cyclase (GGDEF)-like protein
MEKLSQFIIDANREQTKVALLFIDLDNLKNINDSLGHTAGDQVLILAANKFSSCLREGDIIGRLGGDEFIIVMKDFESSVNIANVVKKLIEEFNQPFKYENSELILTTSIGISIYPDDSRNEEELLRFSDIAMYNSKDKGRNQFSFFNNEMQLALNERLAIENEVVYALKRNELTVVYQLQYDL